MDDRSFDALSRRLALSAHRRTVVAAVVALLSGAATTDLAGASRATCRPFGVGCVRGTQCCSGSCVTGRAIPRSKRNRCGCAAGLVDCGSTCVDTAGSMDHCGTCGNACGATRAEACVSGACICGDGPGCDEGFTCLSGECYRTPCMQIEDTCIIDPDGVVLSPYGSPFDLGSPCTSSAACTADDGCIVPPCFCGAEEWDGYGLIGYFEGLCQNSPRTP